MTELLLRPLLRTSSAQPLITHYDDAAGTRIELSVATMANWAAKTANWLVDECDVQPGDHVAVDLPPHWQTMGVLLGTWWCGAHVVHERHGANAAFVGPHEGTGPEDTTALVSLDPMGAGLRTEPPEGALDYVDESRVSGDDFTPLVPVPQDAPALLDHTVQNLHTSARDRATEWGIGSTDRVLSTKPWTFPDGVIAAVLVPLSVGAHLVQVSNPDPDRLATHRTNERTTVDLLA